MQSTRHAKGEFEVNPTSLADERTINGFSRLTIDKVFHGDLEAKSQGQMLSARTETPNSAGYVAVELVEGTLNGRKGSFFLQHNGIMDRGKQSLVRKNETNEIYSRL